MFNVASLRGIQLAHTAASLSVISAKRTMIEPEGVTGQRGTQQYH